jgi:hypothetical protein
MMIVLSNTNPSSRALPGLAMLAACAALGACGNATPTATAAADANPASPTASQAVAPDASGARKPCDYMLRADAEAAMGQALPKTTENVPLGGCLYTSADGYTWGADLTVGDWESIKGAATSGGVGHEPDAVTDVGDQALYAGRPAGILYVRKGDAGFMISLTGPTPTSLPGPELEQDKILARKILARL